MGILLNTKNDLAMTEWNLIIETSQMVIWPFESMDSTREFPVIPANKKWGVNQ